MIYVLLFGFLLLTGLAWDSRRREERLLGSVHSCAGFNMRVVKFEMGQGEAFLERMIPSGYVHAGHAEMTAFLANASSVRYLCFFFAFRGENRHCSVKPDERACIAWFEWSSGNIRREFVSSDDVFEGRAKVFKGFAYALLVECE